MSQAEMTSHKTRADKTSQTHPVDPNAKKFEAPVKPLFYGHVAWLSLKPLQISIFSNG